MKTFLMLLIMSTSGILSNAQVKSEKKSKTVEQTKSMLIHVSADKLWEIIGPGFGDVHKWARGVDHAEISGEAIHEGATCANRSCKVNAKGFSEIDETLIEYNQEDMRLAYTADAGLPSFVLYAANHWKVLDLGNGTSRIEMSLIMKMKPFMGTLMGPLFRRNLNKTLNGYLEDLKIYAETNEISPAKKKRLKKLKKKNI